MLTKVDALPIAEIGANLRMLTGNLAALTGSPKVRDSLEVSDSVLSKHLAALETVNYVKRRKGVHRGRRTTWISLTPRGRKALNVHIAALRALIDGTR